MLIGSPPSLEALVGVKEVTVGPPKYVNPPVDVTDEPSALVTTTFTAPAACAGVVAVTDVKLLKLILVAEVPPKVTAGRLYALELGVKADVQRAIPLDIRNSSMYTVRYSVALDPNIKGLVPASRAADDVAVASCTPLTNIYQLLPFLTIAI